MGKSILHLSVEPELIELAKAKNINISALLSGILEVDMAFEDINKIEDKEILIKKLKAQIGKLASDINEFKKINQRLEKKNSQLKLNNAQLKEKYDSRFIEITS